MKINLKHLKTHKVVEIEIADTATVDTIKQLAIQNFEFDPTANIKLVHGSSILNANKSLPDQKVADGSTIIVNVSQTAKVVETSKVEMPKVAAVSSPKKSESKPQIESKEWFPRSYLDVIAPEQIVQNPFETVADSNMFSPEAILSADTNLKSEKFAEKLLADEAFLEKVISDPKTKDNLKAFFGSREFDFSNKEELKKLIQQSLDAVKKNRESFEEDEADKFEQAQLDRLREMGELNDEFGELPEIPDVQPLQLNFDELKTKYASQLEMIRQMGLTQPDDEILQLLEIAGGNVEIVINQLFGM
ncbi:Rad23 [Spironucleus salmonicida]|uniref:Rad23 n=1 Tax=Spironucleus salmonicida TaxID=348837 RepID=V6LVI8_9EUKA|nr:Rad23 [Spironucleus salmonicida]|eukprot:EST48652.1 Rad23 [Spironucleus salmonicida]